MWLWNGAGLSSGESLEVVKQLRLLIFDPGVIEDGHHDDAFTVPLMVLNIVLRCLGSFYYIFVIEPVGSESTQWL